MIERKENLNVVSGFKIISTEARKVFHNYATNDPFFNIG